MNLQPPSRLHRGQPRDTGQVLPGLNMAEGPPAENLQDLREAIEQLNVETISKTSINDQQIGAPDDDDDDDDDFWCEDGSLNGDPDDGLHQSSILNREWNRRHDQFHTMGYRDGIMAGKEASAQEGFNFGFKQSVHVGYNWGLVRGTSGALANLSDRLKEKMSGTPENKDKLQKFYESVRKISSDDALKMFHDSLQLQLQQTATTKSHDRSEGTSHEIIMENESTGCTNQLETLSKEFISLLHEAPDLKVNVEFGQEITE